MVVLFAGALAFAVLGGLTTAAQPPSLLQSTPSPVLVASTLDDDGVQLAIPTTSAPGPETGTDPDLGSPLSSKLEVASQGVFPTFPLPDGNPPPLGGAISSGSFRDPLPLSPVWNPPGPKRVGLQAGHWLTYDLPFEIRNLSPGSSAGGWAEWEVNLLLVQNTARLLEEAGVDVDILPTTIPVRYRAQAFLSIHADGDTGGAFRGYKIARTGFSSIPEADDAFVRALYDEYGAATGLPRDSDSRISRRMVFYYAFNTRRYQHSVDLGTPSAIIETGFLTSPIDRAFLTQRPDVAARGIANGILRFLSLDLGRDLGRDPQSS